MGVFERLPTPTGEVDRAGLRHSMVRVEGRGTLALGGVVPPSKLWREGPLGVGGGSGGRGDGDRGGVDGSEASDGVSSLEGPGSPGAFRCCRAGRGSAGAAAAASREGLDGLLSVPDSDLMLVPDEPVPFKVRLRKRLRKRV